MRGGFAKWIMKNPKLKRPPRINGCAKEDNIKMNGSGQGAGVTSVVYKRCGI
jgi:hypothetical protein